MRVLLTTLNAKYIHSCLAIAYLREYCLNENWDIHLKEFTINEQTEDIMAEIYTHSPDILSFSCYIWNIEPILEICRDYKKVAPDSIIVLGGPEVSYDAQEVLSRNHQVDVIVRGEGERTFLELLQALSKGQSLASIKGITYRQGHIIHHNPERELIDNLDEIPFPYNYNLDEFKTRTLYYETSRGCPFNCSYCLSSTIKGVRFFSLARVRRDLAFLIKNGVRQVKFVDRTFNCNEKRAKQIMQFIVQQGGNTRFHFEINAEILSPEFLAFLAEVPPGLFDFEIGVQSTWEKALQAINRSHNWARLRENIATLIKLGNIHIHLDLIAGLPYETYQDFTHSFNDVYNLYPDVLQLGFLKLLKGSPLLQKSSGYGYQYQHKPPYRVISNDYISYDELISLSEIEDLLNRYHNTGIVKTTLRFLVGKVYHGEAFNFFEELAEFWRSQGMFGRGHKREAEYSYLKRFVNTVHPRYSDFVNETIKYDFFINNQSYNPPREIESCNPVNINDELYQLLKQEGFIDRHLPHLRHLPIRQIRKLLHLEYFSYDLTSGEKSLRRILFIYDRRQKKAAKTLEL